MIPADALKSPLISPINLWSGDIVLFKMKKPDIIHQRIEKEQQKIFPGENAKWTHAGILRDDYHIIEMTTKGASTTPLWDFQTNKNWDISIRRVKKLSQEGGRTIVAAAYANTNLRSSYDFLAIFKLKRLKNQKDLTSLSTPTIKSSICSALCARAVAPLGIDLGQGVDHRLVTPAQLSYSPLLEDIDVLEISPEDFLTWWKSRNNNLFNE